MARVVIGPSTRQPKPLRPTQIMGKEATTSIPKTEGERLVDAALADPTSKVKKDSAGNITSIETGTISATASNSDGQTSQVTFAQRKLTLSGGKLKTVEIFDTFDSAGVTTVTAPKAFATTKTTFNEAGTAVSNEGFEFRNQRIVRTFQRDLRTGDETEFGTVKSTTLDRGGDSPEQEATSLGLQTETVAGRPKTPSQLREEIKRFKEIQDEAVGQKPELFLDSSRAESIARLGSFREQQPERQIEIEGVTISGVSGGTTFDVPSVQSQLDVILGAREERQRRERIQELETISTREPGTLLASEKFIDLFEKRRPEIESILLSEQTKDFKLDISKVLPTTVTRLEAKPTGTRTPIQETTSLEFENVFAKRLEELNVPKFKAIGGELQIPTKKEGDITSIQNIQKRIETIEIGAIRKKQPILAKITRGASATLSAFSTKEKIATLGKDVLIGGAVTLSASLTGTLPLLAIAGGALAITEIPRIQGAISQPDPVARSEAISKEVTEIGAFALGGVAGARLGTGIKTGFASRKVKVTRIKKTQEAVTEVELKSFEQFRERGPLAQKVQTQQISFDVETVLKKPRTKVKSFTRQVTAPQDITKLTEFIKRKDIRTTFGLKQDPIKKISQPTFFQDVPSKVRQFQTKTTPFEAGGEVRIAQVEKIGRETTIIESRKDIKGIVDPTQFKFTVQDNIGTLTKTKTKTLFGKTPTVTTAVKGKLDITKVFKKQQVPSSKLLVSPIPVPLSETIILPIKGNIILSSKPLPLPKPTTIVLTSGILKQPTTEIKPTTTIKPIVSIEGIRETDKQQIPVLIPLSNQKIETKVKEVIEFDRATILSPLSQPITIQQPIIEDKPIIRTTPIIDVKSDLDIDSIIQPKQLPVTRPPIIQKQPRLPPPKIQLGFPDFRRPPKKLEIQAYSPEVKTKGKFKSVGRRTSRSAALDRAAFVADNSTGATIRAREIKDKKTTRRTSKAPKGYFARNADKFREVRKTFKGKVKSRLPEDTFIEKRKFRIDSPGEKKQLSVARFVAGEKKRSSKRKTTRRFF